MSFVEGRTGVGDPGELYRDAVLHDGHPMVREFCSAPAGSCILMAAASMRPGEVAEPSCRTRCESGAEIRVSDGGIERRNADGTREQLRTIRGVGYACLAPDDRIVIEGPAPGYLRDIEGSFAGWLEVES